MYIAGINVAGTWLVPSKVRGTFTVALLDARMTNYRAGLIGKLSTSPSKGDFSLGLRPNYPISTADLKRTTWVMAHHIDSPDFRDNVHSVALEITFVYCFTNSVVLSGLRSLLTNRDFDDEGVLSGDVLPDDVERLVAQTNVRDALVGIGLMRDFKGKKKVGCGLGNDVIQKQFGSDGLNFQS